MNIKDMRDEFARLLGENENAINRASNEQRGLTAEEKQQNERRYARMDEINVSIRNQDAAVAQAYAAGDVTMPAEPKGKAEYDFRNGIMPALERKTFDSRPLAPSESFATAIRAKDIGFGFGDYLRAMVVGPKNERERFALQQASDSSGGYEVPAPLSAAVIDNTRTGSTFVKAGAMTIPLLGFQNRVIVPSANADPTFRAEGAAVGDSQSLAGATFDLKTIAVTVKVPRELLEDALNVNEALTDHFATAFASELDKAVGWGASGGPTSVMNTANILSVTSAANGDAITDYSKLLSAQYELALQGNAATAAVMSPREFKAFASLKDTTNQPLRRPDALATLPLHPSPEAPINQTQGTSVNASTILVGDWSHLWIGVRDGLRIEVLKETYSSTLSYGFQGWLRVDALVTKPKAFVKVTGIIP